MLWSQGIPELSHNQIGGADHARLLQRRPEGYQMPVQQAPISKPRDGLPVKFRRV